MKLFYYITCLLFLLFLYNCGPSSQDAATFNDKLMSEQKNIVATYDELVSSYDLYELEGAMDSAYSHFCAAIAKTENNLKTIQTIKGGDDLKNATIKYVNACKSQCSNIEELIRMYKLPDGEFTDELRSKWDAIFKEIDTNQRTALDELANVQKEFAKNFNLQIGENN